MELAEPLNTNSKRGVILDVAEQLFAESGFDKTTTRAIAKKANVNIAMLSYYFGSKEQLLYAVLERFSDGLAKVFSHIESSFQSPEDRLRNWILAYVDYIFSNPNHARIVYRQVSVSSKKEDIVKLVSEFNKIRNIVLKALNDGMQSGHFNKLDAQLAITSITAPVNAIVIESNVMKHRLSINAPEGQLYPDEFKQRVKQHMIQMFESLVLPRK